MDNIIKKLLPKKKKPSDTLIGYRHGGIGAYTGEGSPIAWRALDYEYKELGNDHLLKDVARFVGIRPSSWDMVLRVFRAKWGDREGVWLSRTKADSDLYQSYGDLRTYRYSRNNVVSNLGHDGIFVVLGASLPGTEEKSGEQIMEELDKPILTPAPDANVIRAGKGKPKAKYSYYPAGLGATKL